MQQSIATVLLKLQQSQTEIISIPLLNFVYMED